MVGKTNIDLRRRVDDDRQISKLALLPPLIQIEADLYKATEIR